MRGLVRIAFAWLAATAVGQAASAGLIGGGAVGDEQTSVLYDARSGEVAVNAPRSKQLTAINIYSDSGIFIADLPHCYGQPCADLDEHSLFRADFGGGFSDFSWGTIAQAGLAEPFVLSDLSAVGMLLGGGGLGEVDLIYVPVPEPATSVLSGLGAMMLAAWLGLSLRSPKPGVVQIEPLGHAAGASKTQPQPPSRLVRLYQL
jgi:hypothetical protein